MKKIIIGVMGPGATAKEIDVQNAYELGSFIAQEGWILLTGGRNVGVMDAANRGAKIAKGLTVGILPNSDPQAISEAVDIPIITDMGSARNNINALSCNVVIACGIGAGTTSEIALALKANKPVVLLNDDEHSHRFFVSLSKENIFIAENAPAAIAITKQILINKKV